MDSIQEEESEKKYVSVVYHHVSYQNQVDDVIQAAKTGGACHLIRGHEANTTMDIPDYLPLAILSILIFVPSGILATVNSLKVKKSLQQREYTIATEASNWALQHALLAFITGPTLLCLLFTLLYITAH